jgi:lactoylglutathione lyase
MVLEHVAIWTENPQALKDYYSRYFDGKSNELYENHLTGFRSYFLTFQGGARLEIMQKPGIPENLNARKGEQYMGLIHLAFAVPTRGEVEDMAQTLARDGFWILRGPRMTGDGYYEFETLDPDGNRIEVIHKEAYQDVK